MQIFQNGQLLLHYRIQSKLGEGGMGEIYLAEDTKLQRMTAIKVLAPNVSANENAKKRFLQEARSASALNHPNIVTIYAIEDTKDFRFIVMEYVHGETLKERLNRGPLTLQQLIDLGTQIADAVGAAHAIGIIHRDLKPANILITLHEQAKVLDFGISKMLSQANADDAADSNSISLLPENLDLVSDMKLTETGIIMGTVYYMSPEQTRGEPLDARTDVFSLGCLLYEAITGRLPFQGPKLEVTIQNIRSVQPAVPSTFNSDLPKELDQLIQCALAKDRNLRYANATELANALRKLQFDTTTSKIIMESYEQKNVVAVLDFTNITGDPSIDWLSSGIAETVTIDLKKVTQLKVLNREKIYKALESSLTKNFTQENVQRLGEELGLNWIIWGGFQRVGDAIRITAQFTDIANDESIVSAKIDGKMDEIFQLQDRIITSMLDVLRIQISHSDMQKIEKPETELLKAYEYYVRGRELFNRFGKTSFEEAHKFFEKALEIDPSYALAYSGLGSIYIFKFIAHTDPRDLAIGISHLQKAQELDPDLHEPYDWLTYAYARKHEFEKSIEVGKHAVKLDPENGNAHYFLGTSYTALACLEKNPEYFKDAIQSFKSSINVMPNYEPAYLSLGWIYMIHGYYQKALEFLDQAEAVEAMPKRSGVSFVGAKTLLGNLCLRQHQFDAALKHYEDAMVSLRETDHVYRVAFLVLTYRGIGDVFFSRHEQDEAASQYQKACDLISHHPKVLAAGYFLVSSKLRLAMAKNDPSIFDEAYKLFSQKDGYDFHWIWEATDALIHYDIAAYYAITRQNEQALKSLRNAVECGWGDSLFMNSDPRMATLRTEKQFAELIKRSEKISSILRDRS